VIYAFATVFFNILTVVVRNEVISVAGVGLGESVEFVFRKNPIVEAALDALVSTTVRRRDHGELSRKFIGDLQTFAIGKIRREKVGRVWWSYAYEAYV
jgi:hypothetical protein